MINASFNRWASPERGEWGKEGGSPEQGAIASWVLGLTRYNKLCVFKKSHPLCASNRMGYPSPALLSLGDGEVGPRGRSKWQMHACCNPGHLSRSRTHAGAASLAVTRPAPAA